MNAESKQGVLLDSLNKFYTDHAHLKLFTEVIRNESGISLRILDWLVTNYSKKKNIVYLLGEGDDARSFNMFLEYKSQLKGFSKRYFDPFCRRERVDFLDTDGEPFQTTLGQMNFFRWAIIHGVLTYGRQNNQDIESDMMDSIRHRFRIGSERQKRKELSKAAVKTCTKTLVKVTVRFQ